MLPIHKPYADMNYEPSITEKFTILLFHGSQFNQISNLRYTGALNLHTNYEAMKKKRMTVSHLITQANI